eukprot:1389633-Pyramimonas_sp.AAC.2
MGHPRYRIEIAVFGTYCDLVVVAIAAFIGDASRMRWWPAVLLLSSHGLPCPWKEQQTTPPNMRYHDS